MSDKIKWGVIGTANIARTCTIPAMLKAKNCELYGIASRTLAKAEEFRGIFGFKKAYGSYEALLDDPEIQAVYIPLPNHMHKEWVIKAAKKKKNILCEKPLSGTPADVQEMIDACDREGVIFMEAFAYLHSPAIKSIRQKIAEGAIGEVTVIETTFITPGYTDDIRIKRETLGGAVYDLGCYNISMILGILGEEPMEVGASAHFNGEHIDDFTTAYLSFPSGVKASVFCAMCSGRRGDRVVVYGTKGTLFSDIRFNQEGTLTYRIVRDDSVETVTVDTPDNYTLEIEQLGRCITDGEKPFVTHQMSMTFARTIEKVLRACNYY
ncbi:MAG: Gfo/Idh/MocA family protein [Oscillospiraceae bacterium]